MPELISTGWVLLIRLELTFVFLVSNWLLVLIIPELASCSENNL